MPSRADFRRMFAPIRFGTLIGSALGILPGGGAMLASFAVYSVEKKVSKNSAEFGSSAAASALLITAHAAFKTTFLITAAIAAPSFLMSLSLTDIPLDGNKQ
jgi:putative tricarboxylic transport membrane protein